MKKFTLIFHVYYPRSCTPSYDLAEMDIRAVDESAAALLGEAVAKNIELPSDREMQLHLRESP